MTLHVHHHAVFAQDHAVIGDVLTLGNVLPSPAQHGADAGNELAGKVRLGHVIIRAELQAHYLVDLTIARSHHDHGNGGSLAQLTAHLGAGHSGEHQIQQDNIHLFGGEDLESSGAITSQEDFKALFLEQERQWLCQGFLVFDNENAGHVYSRPSLLLVGTWCCWSCSVLSGFLRVPL